MGQFVPFWRCCADTRYGPGSIGEPSRKPRISINDWIEMATGTVKFFNADKGFGFITPDGSGPDVFVHISGIEQSGLKTLSENQKVSYDTEPDTRGKGPKATNLKVL